MSNIKIPNECEEHRKKIYTICLEKNCKNRFLCHKCFKSHEQSHSINFVPLNELIDENNNIILFNDYIKENNGRNNELLKLKEEAIKEINKIIDEIKIKINNKINEIITEFVMIEKLKNINSFSFEQLTNLYYIINDENKKENKENDIKKISKLFGELKIRLNYEFENVVEQLNDEFQNFNYYPTKLKQIEAGNKLINVNSTYGRILFDEVSKKVYCYTGLNTNTINLYDNYHNFKSNNINKTITISSKISGTYSVLHKQLFYFFEFNSNSNKNTNKIVKYDLNQNKILGSNIILQDAVLENSQNCWGGYNDIILISDNNKLYAVYSSINNYKRISIALINENNLNVIKVWNTDSLERKQCGPIFMINNILYHIKTYDSENDSIVYSYNLITKKSEKMNIPFGNKGGYDTSLTYYSHLKCLMTINNSYAYRYNVILEETN